MTKIIANSMDGKQIIFNSYKECKDEFQTSEKEMKTAILKGIPITDMTSGKKYWLDELFYEDE